MRFQIFIYYWVLHPFPSNYECILELAAFGANLFPTMTKVIVEDWFGWDFVQMVMLEVTKECKVQREVSFKGLGLGLVNASFWKGYTW